MSASENRRPELAGVVVDELFRLVKSISSHEPDHPVTTRAVDDLLASILDLSPPLTLQFVGDAVFCDYEMVPLTPKRFDQVRRLTTALDAMGHKEIAIDAGVEAWELLELGSVLSQGALGRASGVDALLMEHVRWRDLPQIRWGEESERADLEVFASAQIQLALLEAEALSGAPDKPWSWAHGQKIVRRLENAVRRSPHQACFVAETVELPWTPRRRAVCAALHAQQVLDSLGVSRPVTRATVHATLALGIQGFDLDSGLSFDEAAAGLLARLVRVTSQGRRGLDPHRLRVCALIHSLVKADGARAGWFGPHHLLHLAYELERGRWPDALDDPLTLVDLLAEAVLTRGDRFSPHLLQILISVTGALPPGTRVQLEDGRLGYVVGLADEPWRPRVKVGDAIEIPTGPVQAISGAIATF